MTETIADTKSTYHLPPLPENVATKDGAFFDPRLDVWLLEALVLGRRRFDFLRFSSISGEMRHKLKLGLLWHLQHNSFSHAQNLFQRFTAFYFEQLSCKNDTCDVLDLADILTYRAKLDATTEWKLGALRILMEDMEKLGFGIASADALGYLREATFRGNVKGTSVRTRDREKGAFNDTELLAIQSALNDAYACGEIDLYHFAMTWLFLGYGPRPIQIAALKESDLIVSEGNQSSLYALRVPRAKQRGENIRGSFKTRYCSKQIGQLLEEVIGQNRRRREQLGLEGENWPMFMSKSEGKLPDLKYHISSLAIGKMVNHVTGRITGLKTNAKRFRITLAQRAVDDGKDKYTVAELLDHSDTQNVGVYYEASPSMVQRLDRHLAMEMAPLAQAFAGVVVKMEAEARRGGDQSSRIYDRSLPDNVADPLGTCGQMSFCGLAVPFACYTCRHFQPWLDGPHEEFMAALIDDRERMVEEDYSPKIYAIRDRTILAVAEVIQLCAAEREQIDGGVA